jgi:Secretion system C-terminal sorting domain
VKVELKPTSKPQEPILVGPNPYRDRLSLNVQSVNPGMVGVSLFNASGAVLRKWNFGAESGENVFKLEQLEEYPHGTYILKITNTDGKTYSRQLLKR